MYIAETTIWEKPVQPGGVPIGCQIDNTVVARRVKSIGRRPAATVTFLVVVPRQNSIREKNGLESRIR
jgi:hypothetical protein